MSHLYWQRGRVVLTNSSITGGDLSFTASIFKGDAEHGVDATRATVTGVFFWNTVSLTPRTLLILEGVALGCLSDTERSWPQQGNLRINGLTYTSLAPADVEYRLRWLGRQAQTPFYPQPYEQVMRVLRTSGHEKDAIRIAVAREDARRKYGGLGHWSRAWSWLLKVTIGYGYKPHRALVGALVFILLGWLLFGFGYEQGLMIPTKDAEIRNPLAAAIVGAPAGYPSFNPLIYSLDTFLPIVDLDQASKWQPNDHRTCSSFDRGVPCGLLLRWYLWVQILMGWLLTTLGVAAITGLVRRG